MPKRYVLTELAQEELEDILRYIARRGDVDTALRVEDEFRTEFRRLAENPLIGHHRSDIPSVYRVWSLYDYLIIYKPDTRPLQILRIWHGARRSRARRWRPLDRLTAPPPEPPSGLHDSTGGAEPCPRTACEAGPVFVSHA